MNSDGSKSRSRSITVKRSGESCKQARITSLKAARGTDHEQGAHIIDPHKNCYQISISAHNSWSGERCERPSGVWGGAPASNDFGEFWFQNRSIWCNNSEYCMLLYDAFISLNSQKFLLTCRHEYYFNQATISFVILERYIMFWAETPTVP